MADQIHKDKVVSGMSGKFRADFLNLIAAVSIISSFSLSGVVIGVYYTSLAIATIVIGIIVISFATVQKKDISPGEFGLSLAFYVMLFFASLIAGAFAFSANSIDEPADFAKAIALVWAIWSVFVGLWIFVQAYAYFRKFKSEISASGLSVERLTLFFTLMLAAATIALAIVLFVSGSKVSWQGAICGIAAMIAWGAIELFNIPGNLKTNKIYGIKNFFEIAAAGVFVAVFSMMISNDYYTIKLTGNENTWYHVLYGVGIGLTFIGTFWGMIYGTYHYSKKEKAQN